jgi:hypothetical protein
MLFRASLAALALSGAVSAQTPVVTPLQTARGPQGESDYGPPVFADLNSIAFHPEAHQRQHVRTRGRLDMIDTSNLLLTDGTARVLLLLANGAPGDLMAFVGGQVELRGIVRQLRKKQYVNGVDLDLIEDPSLPVLPSPSPTLPEASITVFSLSDIEGTVAKGPEVLAARTLTENIVQESASYVGKTVRIVGLFRGRNLFGDLPANSQHEKSDWVLKDGDSALWVVGKDPRGKGWALDPDYKGDSVRWLEVQGKPEVANGIVYLRATRVRLSRKPEELSDDAPQ